MSLIDLIAKEQIVYEGRWNNAREEGEKRT